LPCQIFSRVTGFYAAIDNWNDGKREEFKERKTYNMTKFGVNIPKHELKTTEELEAERISIGKECWDKMGDNVYYEDIDAQTRLLDQERKSVLDKKLSNSKIIKVGDETMKKFLEGIVDGIIKKALEKYLTQEKIELYISKGIKFIIDLAKMGLDKLAEFAKTTDTKVDDMIIESVIKAFDNISGKEKEE